MKIEIVSQIKIENIVPLASDYLICASGYETRSVYIGKTIGNMFENKLVFGVSSYMANANRQKNDEFFNKNGFIPYLENEGTGDKIISALYDIIENSNGSLSIYIDYSSMPRTWYSEIIRFLRAIKFGNKISLIFMYSEGKFVNPSNVESYNHYVEPLRGFTFAGIPDKPTALIIGLGYESRRPLGLREYFDASKLVLFITDEETSGKYYDEVMKKNCELIELVERKNPNDIFGYPINDQEYTYFLLDRVCNELQKNYKIIIAPCGPKFFTLCSLLVTFKNFNFDVWRISAGEGRHPFDREPSGEIMCLRVDFVNE